MTLKEKAKELVGRFYVWTSRNTTKVNIAHYDAKQCALICVDEMLKPIFMKGKRYDRTLEEVLFLQEVKQEIEKL